MSSLHLLTIGLLTLTLSSFHAAQTDDPRAVMGKAEEVIEHIERSSGKTSLISPDDPESKERIRIVNLYDAFGEEQEEMQLDWGFSAFVEYRGRRILFDGGNSPEILARNAHAQGIDLSTVDIAILSHRHPDHASGLDYLLEVNPDVALYLPAETSLGAPEPFDLGEVSDEVIASLLPRQLYFGRATKTIDFNPGDRFRDARSQFISSSREIAPGIDLIVTMNERFQIHELSLALKIQDGVVLISGCSHSGLPVIVQELKSRTQDDVVLLLGGYHLGWTSMEKIKELARTLKNDLGVKRVAPAHCSGYGAFKVFQDVFADDFIFFGLGREIELED